MEQEIPQHQYPDYRLLCIVSSKTNPNYNTFKKLLDDPSVKEKLTARNISVVENIIEDPKKFIISLYNINMNLLMSINTPTSESLDTIFKTADEYTRKTNPTLTTTPKSTGINTNAQTGGRINYKDKYLKYKKKCSIMKKVVTSYVRHD